MRGPGAPTCFAAVVLVAVVCATVVVSCEVRATIATDKAVANTIRKFFILQLLWYSALERAPLYFFYVSKIPECQPYLTI
jgi:hypothetical protein